MLTNEKDIIDEAITLHQEKKLDEAEKLYLQVINNNENNYNAYNLLGLLYLQKKDFNNAEIHIKKAFSLQEDSYIADNLGKVYQQSGEYKKAITTLEKAHKLDPKNETVLFDLALAYRSDLQFEKAKEVYYKVIELNPKFNEAYFNLAYLYFSESKPLEAVKCYEKVLELDPTDIDTRYFLSLAYMQTKNYEKGLLFFENRLCRLSAVALQQKTYPNLLNSQNIWRGEDISDKTIYTYYEAGFGDVIMFSRYLKLLEKKCKKIIFKPQDELYELFKENFPNIEIVKYFKEEKDMHFDVHLPMLSLPYIMKLKDDEIFMLSDGYLKANPQKVDKYKTTYFNNDKFKIGIKWQGNTFYDQERVIPTESFFKLMEIPNTKFYSCQTFDGSEKIKSMQEKYEVIDLSKTFSDFSDTIAAVENLDLVICNDTSLAHIAGTIGKPCWILLPKVYNWRWHTDLSKCDWYKSVKLFRQTEARNWTELMDRVKAELIKTING